MGVEYFCTELPKGTPVGQIWFNKSFVICGSDVALRLCGGEKKVREDRHWKLDSTITLRRYRAVVKSNTTQKKSNKTKQHKVQKPMQKN